MRTIAIQIPEHVYDKLTEKLVSAEMSRDAYLRAMIRAIAYDQPVKVAPRRKIKPKDRKLFTLTSEQINAIKADDRMSDEIASEYGVSVKYVSDVKHDAMVHDRHTA